MFLLILIFLLKHIVMFLLVIKMIARNLCFAILIEEQDFELIELLFVILEE